jgi:hypothetical protein
MIMSNVDGREPYLLLHSPQLEPDMLAHLGVDCFLTRRRPE